MMIILDTNVVSEVFKPRPDAAVARWLGSQPQKLYFLTAISKAELLFGLACMPDGQRKRDLADVMWQFFREKVPNPILTFDGGDAEHYAEISAVRRRLGRRMGELDAQIAAIARSRSYSVATRDIQDFEECGIELINPWEFVQ
jgi:toxin FitB